MLVKKLKIYLAYVSLTVLFVLMVAIVIYQKTRIETADVEKPQKKYTNLFSSPSNHIVTKEILNGLNEVSIILQNRDNIELFSKFINIRAINFAAFMQNRDNDDKMRILNKFTSDLFVTIHDIFMYKAILINKNSIEYQCGRQNVVLAQNNDKRKFIFLKKFERRQNEDIQKNTYSEIESYCFLNTSGIFELIVKEISKDMLDKIQLNEITKYAIIILQRMYFLITHLEIISSYFVQKNIKSEKYAKDAVSHVKRIFNNIYDEKYDFEHLTEVKYDKNSLELYIEFTDK